jgi:nucleotide-binding universal stress UspA family protein
MGVSPDGVRPIKQAPFKDMATRPLLCAIGADDGPRLLEVARRVAADLRAPVRFLHVVGPPVAPVGDPGAFPGVGAPLHGTTAALDRSTDDAYTAGMTLLTRAGATEEEAMVAVGEPADTIAQLAEEVGARMIVACTRGRGALAGAFLGSVSRSLVRHAGCPVMIVRSNHRASKHGPVVCGHAAGRPEAAAVIALAAELARDLDRPLALVHVLELVAVVAAGGAAPVPAAVINEAERDAAREALESVAAEAGAQDAELVLLQGVPCQELDRFAAEREAAMIVVGCRGHGNLHAALAGSVSLDLAQGEGCPVVVAGPRVTD